MRLHAIDVAADDLVVLAEADVVILAAPVRQNVALLSSSTRNVRAARRSSPTPAARSAHRRGGARPARALHLCRRPSARRRRRGGLEHARPDLFREAAVAVHAVRRRAGEAVEKLDGVRIGARRRAARLDAAAHDRLLAFLSHLPQLAASALMDVVGDAVGDEGLRWPAAAWSTRRAWRRARPTSGATSPPPTPTDRRRARRAHRRAAIASRRPR